MLCPLFRPFRRDEQVSRAHIVPLGSGVLEYGDDVSDRLNVWIRSNVAQYKPCDEFSTTELADLTRRLLSARDPSFNHVYRERDGRRLRHESISAYEAEWNTPIANAAHETIARQGRCFEAVNLFVHQLSTPCREHLNVTLPLLPSTQHARRLVDAVLYDGHVAATTRRDIEQASIVYSKQSPCTLAHKFRQDVHAPDAARTFNRVADAHASSTPVTRPDGGYSGCTDDDKRWCRTGHRNYYLRAVLRNVTINGTEHLTDDGRPLVFESSTFELDPGWNDNHWVRGMDGTAGILGPTLVANPGERVNLFVSNTLPGVRGGVTREDVHARLQKVRAVRDNATVVFSHSNFAVHYSGPEFYGPNREGNLAILTGEAVSAPDLRPVRRPNENQPGHMFGGYNSFNVHLHGYEVTPHLFHPLGTRNASAEWIQIAPLTAQGSPSARSCYCYNFEVSRTMSKGVFLYHTHLHGTTSVLTWGGMVGLALSQSLSVNEEGTLLHALWQKDKRITDDDLHIFAITNVPVDRDGDLVRAGGFLRSSGQGAASDLNLFLVNGAYQPTLRARARVPTVFEIVCISASKLCAWMLIDESNRSVGFQRLGSDGIAYNRSVYSAPGRAERPDVNSNHAYVSLGGGQRETVAVVFDGPAVYRVEQRSVAFDDAVEQLLATVEVRDEVRDEDRHATSHVFPLHMPGARSVKGLVSRTPNRSRVMRFAENYNQSQIPFVQYGVGSAAGDEFRPYALHDVGMEITGGECEVWTVWSTSSFIHPFHIHVNPFVVLESYSNYSGKGELVRFYDDYTPPFVTHRGTALPHIWRDTVMVPPFGYVKLLQCFDAGVDRESTFQTFAGKFVFHCHFLVHEDTGLMHNVMLHPASRLGRYGVESGAGLNKKSWIALTVAIALIGLASCGALAACVVVGDGSGRSWGGTAPTVAA